MKRIPVHTKLDCLNQAHQEEEIKAVCLNPTCTENPFLCALCLTQFKHEHCKFMIITIKEMRKRNIWRMENWPSNKEDMSIKHRIQGLERMEEVMRLVDKLADHLQEECQRSIAQFRVRAKDMYPTLLESKEFDVYPLKELFIQSYGVEVPNKIVDAIQDWKINMYEASQQLSEYRASDERRTAISDLRELNEKGKYMTVPNPDVIERSLKVIKWQLKNLEEQIYSLKVVTRTIEFEKKIIEEEDGVYEGETNDSLKHGNGTFFMKNGNKFEGEMYRNKMQGQGKYSWKNGNKYQGSFLNDKICGFGKMVFSNGDLYQGEFLNNKASGEGRLITAQGEVYEGSFYNNLRQGYGIQFLKNGSKYQGQFYKGKWHGKGKITSKSGRIQQGIWIDNIKQ